MIAGSIQSPELGTLLWEAGPGRGFKLLKAYLHDLSMRGYLKIDDADRATRMLIGMFVGELSIRTILGLATMVRTEEAKRDWATYVVDKFLMTFA